MVFMGTTDTGPVIGMDVIPVAGDRRRTFRRTVGGIDRRGTIRGAGTAPDFSPASLLELFRIRARISPITTVIMSSTEAIWFM